MNEIIKIKIQSAFKECDAHIEKLSRAYLKLERLFPLSAQSFSEFSEENITFLDQFLYRFIKLQDAMGIRLFPVITGLIAGDNDPRPFIDILNILEKNQVIISAEKWQELRNIRNMLAHEYPENIDQTVRSLNALMEEWEQLLKMYLSVKIYYNDRLTQK